MKKFLAILLTLTIIAGMSGVVFADNNGNGEDYKDSEKVKIEKKIELTNKDTVHPEETFTFEIGKGTGVRDEEDIEAPQFDEDNNTFTIKVGQGGLTGSADINLPDFNQVGVYTYLITEVEGETAGMTYDGKTYYLVITVINDPDNPGEFLRVLTMKAGDDEDIGKEDAFVNEFSAGDLTIGKIITGNYSDPEDVFEVTVTITPDEGKTINADPIDWNTENVTEEDGVYTAVYTLKGDGTVTIQNLPYDVTYKVEETDSGKYTLVSYSTIIGSEEDPVESNSGSFDAESIEVTITNNRDTVIPVGVALDNLPYIIAIAVVILGLAVFTVRRRIFN